MIFLHNGFLLSQYEDVLSRLVKVSSVSFSVFMIGSNRPDTLQCLYVYSITLSATRPVSLMII